MKIQMHEGCLIKSSVSVEQSFDSTWLYVKLKSWDWADPFAFLDADAARDGQRTE